MMEHIGKKLFEVRKNKGFTQEELSDLAKINLRTLQRIEKGETEPRGNTLRNLCRVLDIPVEDILVYGKAEDRKFMVFFHLSVLTFIFIPMGNILLPLILWMTKRDRIIGLNEQGVDLLNFQITWSILLNVSVFLFAFSKIMHMQTYVPVILIAGFLYVINIVYPIVVSIKVKKGRMKKWYSLGIRFIKY